MADKFLDKFKNMMGLDTDSKYADEEYEDYDGEDGDEDDGVEGDVGDVEEMSPGAAKANRFGDSVPASATRFGVADVMIVDITVEGEAVGVDDRNLAARPATCGDAIDVPVRV